MGTGMDEKAVLRGVELRFATLADGLEHAIPEGVTTLTVGGVVYEIADLVAHIHELEKPWKDVREARAVIRAAMHDRPKDHSNALEFLADAKVALVAILGRTSQELSKFGVKPQKRSTPLTSDQKVLRAAKARATRALRHTMGRRQKAELKATDVTSVVVSADGVHVAPPASEPVVSAPPASAATPAAPAGAAKSDGARIVA